MSCECKRQGDLCDPCTDLIAIGERQERERIIALLESKAFRHGCEESATTGCLRCHIGIHEAVNLIKETA